MGENHAVDDRGHPADSVVGRERHGLHSGRLDTCAARDRIDHRDRANASGSTPCVGQENNELGVESRAPPSAKASSFRWQLEVRYSEFVV